MASRRKVLDAEIASQLDAASVPGSPNRITARPLRHWAIKYLTEHDEEVARLPELAARPHWNLWMMDAWSEDALFAVLVFRPDGIEFFCGTGDARAVKTFAESEFPDNPDGLLGMMAARFCVPAGSIHCDRRVAEDWLGRAW